jgi:hypothetical protein
MSYEIRNAAAARRRQLHKSDASRYGEVRLVVQTMGPSQVICTLIVGRVGGGRMAETRLGFCTLPRQDVGGRWYTHIELLELALERLRSEA